MRISEEEYYQYLRIHPKLIYYVGLRENLINKGIDIDEFMNFSAEEKMPIRDALYRNPKYIEDFIKENPYSLSKEDLEIAKGFEDFREGRFWIIKLLKKHAIFLDDDYAYEVLALNDPFEMFFGRNLPVMIETALLPFKGKIIYDGMMRGYNISFGRGIRSQMTNKYHEVKARTGLISSLPVDEKLKNKKLTDRDKLILYMKTSSSREQYWYEIEDLLEENPTLVNLYTQLWGKINTRSKKKALKELGLNGYYFGIHDDVIIASSKTKKDLESQLRQMLKEEDIESIHIFKV